MNTIYYWWKYNRFLFCVMVIADIIKATEKCESFTSVVCFVRRPMGLMVHSNHLRGLSVCALKSPIKSSISCQGILTIKFCKFCRSYFSCYHQLPKLEHLPELWWLWHAFLKNVLYYILIDCLPTNQKVWKKWAQAYAYS